MMVSRTLRRLVPESAKHAYHALIKHPYLSRRYGVDSPKLAEELHFWNRRYRDLGRTFANKGYERMMLEIAAEPDPSFLTGRVVADFGCGPRGSLVWARAASRRIGIDILADHYGRLFDTAAHHMEYVASTESCIPLPDGLVDVLFCINALDHTARPATMAAEMLRILAPQGLLIGSFNLGLTPTVCEPSPMSREFLDSHLLRHLEILSLCVAPRCADGDVYSHCREAADRPPGDGASFAWVKGQKV